MKSPIDLEFVDSFCKFLTEEYTQFFKKKKGKINVRNKSDRSQVTELDLFISRVIKNKCSKIFENFYSEEDYDELIFPTVILDPLDGTKEFIQGRDEWCVSILFAMNSEISSEKNRALIFQPHTQFRVDSFSIKTIMRNDSSILVSRTEFEEEMHAGVDFKLVPCGSIALKLAKLYMGEALAVCSLKPKHIWDIAAGTILLKSAGYNFYSQSNRVDHLDKKLYLPPLIWVKPEEKEKLPKFYRSYLGKDN